MGNYKERPKYNVVSMRVSDEEKALLDRFSRVTHMSVSKVMREAMRRYSPQLECLGSNAG